MYISNNAYNNIEASAHSPIIAVLYINVIEILYAYVIARHFYVARSINVPNYINRKLVRWRRQWLAFLF